MRGSTLDSSAHVAAGSASMSNQVNDAGMPPVKPLTASAPSTSGDRSSLASPPQRPRALSRAARTTSFFSLASAVRTAGTEAARPNEPTQAAAETRPSTVLAARPCSASSRTRGWERSAAWASGRFTFEEPTAISAITGSSSAGIRGKASMISRARGAVSVSVRDLRSTSRCSAYHGQDTSGSTALKMYPWKPPRRSAASAAKPRRAMRFSMARGSVRGPA